MMLKRAQGRPIRGVDDVGREKLLEGARVVFRSKLTLAVSRQVVARAAGVTPALVSYYFADKASLVLAAARPVMDRYTMAAVDIVECDTPFNERLEHLVMLFLQLAAEESGMLDVYFAYACERSGNPAMAPIPDAWDRLATFFEAGARAEAWRSVEPGLLVPAIWGMCKALAEPIEAPKMAFDEDSSSGSLRRRQANFIVAFLRDGLRPGCC